MTETKKSDQPSNVMTRQAALATMLFTSPVIIIFAYLGKFDKSLGAWACAAIVVHSIRAHWSLRTNPWFGLAITAAVVIQLPFAVPVPWSDRYMSMVALLPFALLDYVVVEWCIKLADKIANKQPSPPSA